jgi:hypothetical protein
MGRVVAWGKLPPFRGKDNYVCASDEQTNKLTNKQ